MAFSTHYPIQKILLLFYDFCEGKKQFHTPDPPVPTTPHCVIILDSQIFNNFLPEQDGCCSAPSNVSHPACLKKKIMLFSTKNLPLLGHVGHLNSVIALITFATKCFSPIQ
jgi:hypothetical protein